MAYSLQRTAPCSAVAGFGGVRHRYARAMNPNEAQQATGDIYYEAEMLRRAYIEYWEHESSARQHVPEWVHNCILEATLVHIRALLEFFEHSRDTKSRRPPHSDDVLPEDYGFAASQFSIPQDLRRRINTSIAHLSYGRTRIPDDEAHWDFTGFIPPILSRAGEFFSHLLETDQARSSFPGDEKLQNFIAYAKPSNS